MQGNTQVETSRPASRAIWPLSIGAILLLTGFAYWRE